MLSSTVRIRAGGVVLFISSIYKFYNLLANFTIFKHYISPKITKIVPINFCFRFWGQITVCVLFGAFGITVFSLMPGTCVAILGVERISSAVGIILFMCGLGYVVGPPFGGMESHALSITHGEVGGSHALSVTHGEVESSCALSITYGEVRSSCTLSTWSGFLCLFYHIWGGRAFSFRIYHT